MRFGQDGDAPFANLRWEWSTNNLIGNRYFQWIFALDAWNRLAAHLCTATTGRDMNLLLSFTAWAFQRRNNVPLIGRHWLSMRKKLHSVAVPRKIKRRAKGAARRMFNFALLCLASTIFCPSLGRVNEKSSGLVFQAVVKRLQTAHAKIRSSWRKSPAT